jgi:phage-related protein
MRKIVFYNLPSGKSPVEEFLNSLSGKDAQKVVWVLQLIEELGVVPANYLKNLVNTDGIIEVRVRSGNNIFRILGFRDGNDFVVLTNGFHKKSQQTPRKEIKLAEERKKDYLSRKGKK